MRTEMHLLIFCLQFFLVFIKKKLRKSSKISKKIKSSNPEFFSSPVCSCFTSHSEVLYLLYFTCEWQLKRWYEAEVLKHVTAELQ